LFAIAMESEVKLGGKIEIAVESDEGKEDELDGRKFGIVE
jgi:acyl-ACP thioesterase